MNTPKQPILSVLLIVSMGLVASAQMRAKLDADSAHGARPGPRESDSAKPASAGKLLTFAARPIKPSFKAGEEVVFRFRLKNLSSKRIFVSRYLSIGDFVTLELTGPDGKKVPWQGKVRSIGYNKDAFLMLDPRQEISVRHTISVIKDEGFVIDKPGWYTARAEYALGPPEYFANLAPKESIPEGQVKAPIAHFTVITSQNAHP